MFTRAIKLVPKLMVKLFNTLLKPVAEILFMPIFNIVT
jgi:hypothetical protein